MRQICRWGTLRLCENNARLLPKAPYILWPAKPHGLGEHSIWVNGPLTQRPLHPGAQVLAWLFECERTQVSHSFALLKQVRWWG